MTEHQAFAADEDGAVTVDWVVLTAALVGLGLAVIGVTATGVQSAAVVTTEQVGGMTVATRFADDGSGLDFGQGGADSGAFSYDPYDQAMFDDLVERLAGLSDEDLVIADAIMSQAAAAAALGVTSGGYDLTEWQQGQIDDVDGALGTVAHARGIERNRDGVFTQADQDRVETAMWGAPIALPEGDITTTTSTGFGSST